jgi:hypothetical protein
LHGLRQPGNARTGGVTAVTEVSATEGHLLRDVDAGGAVSVGDGGGSMRG